ncbi:MAG: hypothetical protein GTO29_00275 [Candidatus Latescibacteria bacterium]|nr:hypothetical protein [Candidatus Latescibacterota bacterium]NIO56048.1 hypothetical protein [Candidatus Latescibacterota bacterium]
MLHNLSRKNKHAWVVTSEMAVIQSSKMLASIGILALVSFNEPVKKQHAYVYDGQIFGDIKEMPGDLEKIFRSTIQTLGGEYSLAATDGNKIAVARDSLGRRPIFYAKNEEILAYACEKKALWSIGLRNVKPLRAGTSAVLDENGIKIVEAAHFKKRDFKQQDFDSIVKEYEQLLIQAFEKRLEGQKKIGALLSGGVDSTLSTMLTSKYAREMGEEIIVYTAGTKDAIDVAFAERFTREFGLNHKVRKLDVSDVANLIPKVVKAVEERDFVQVEAGIGVYAAEEMAAHDGVELIVSGQGPDELWGGYRWYPRVIAEEGYDAYSEKNWGDLTRADIETLDRENKLAWANGLKAVFPYIDTAFVNLAMSVPPQLKINSPNDAMGKRPHRALAKKVGIPQEFADRGKDAAQHGTGIHDLLDAVAKQNDFTPDLVRKVNYKSADISDEYLSSSARYGYRYADKKLWLVDEHIQFYIDSVAHRKGILNESERKKIETYLEKI